MSDNNLLADFLDLGPFAHEVGREPRTVRRWMDEPDGLPFTRIGNRILVHVPTAREWILGRMRHPAPRRAERRKRESATA
jgi:hypothetical protein